MIGVIAAIVGIGLVAGFVVWWWRRAKRPQGRSETCAACRHDLMAHRTNTGATRCQCCLRHRGRAKKNH